MFKESNSYFFTLRYGNQEYGKTLTTIENALERFQQPNSNAK